MADGIAFRWGSVLLVGGVLIAVPLARASPSLLAPLTPFGFRPLVGGFLVSLAVAAVVAPVLWISHRRRRRRAWHGDASVRFGDACPSCGRGPEADRPCCPRMPADWCDADRLAFWHEVETATTHLGETRRSPNPWSVNTTFLTDAERRRRAWYRPRGPHGSSPAVPRGGVGHWTLAGWRLFGSMFWAAVLAWYLARASLGPTSALDLEGFIGLALPAILIWGVIPHIRECLTRSAPPVPRCRSCGFEIHGSPGTRCPECGSGLNAWNSVSFVPDWPGDDTRRPVTGGRPPSGDH